MSTKTSSPKSEERRERQRVAAVEGTKALAEYEANDAAVRKNMARLRELRLAQEAKEREAKDSAGLPLRPARKARTKKPPSTVLP
jgi:hypothetical protein